MILLRRESRGALAPSLPLRRPAMVAIRAPLAVLLATCLAGSLASAAEDEDVAKTSAEDAAAPKSRTLGFSVRLLTLDANEGIAAADIDGDGRRDLVAGRNWFRNPDWASRPVRIIEDWNGYVQSNGDYIMDINGDDRPDVVAGSFLPSEVNWFENPGDEGLRLGHLWPSHQLVDTGNTANEGQLLEDLDGDGVPEWIVNSWQRDVPMVVWRFLRASNDDAANQPLKLRPHELGPQGNGHGVGLGDLSGDGKPDVLVGQGWYEQPESDPWTQPWAFHADWDLNASLPMLVRDLTDDGRADLVFGNGHDYGLYWWENTGTDPDGRITWKEHLIDRGYSQPHSMVFADLDGDGQDELVTGKRYYAHNGGDPGGQEPPCLYYYTWDAAARRFDRHTIDEGRVGTGLQIVVEDFDGDGRADIAVAGKSGTYLLSSEAE